MADRAIFAPEVNDLRSVEHAQMFFKRVVSMSVYEYLKNVNTRKVRTSRVSGLFTISASDNKLLTEITSQKYHFNKETFFCVFELQR